MLQVKNKVIVDNTVVTHYLMEKKSIVVTSIFGKKTFEDTILPAAKEHMERVHLCHW